MFKDVIASCQQTVGAMAQLVCPPSGLSLRQVWYLRIANEKAHATKTIAGPLKLE